MNADIEGEGRNSWRFVPGQTSHNSHLPGICPVPAGRTKIAQDKRSAVLGKETKNKHPLFPALPRKHFGAKQEKGALQCSTSAPEKYLQKRLEGVEHNLWNSKPSY